MKKRYYLITGIVAYLVLLLTDVPAATVLALMPETSPVELQNVSGSIWNGRAGTVVINNGHRLSDANWSFKPTRLLIGKAAVAIDARYLDQPLEATASIGLTGRVGIEELVYAAEAGIVNQLAALPLGELGGDIRISIEDASWSHGRVPLVTGNIEWQKAAITIAETAQLGDVDILIREGEDAPLQATINNKGGQISLSGDARIDEQGNFELEIRLKPLPGASANIGNSIAMFARRLPDGQYAFTQKGSLKQLGLM